MVKPGDQRADVSRTPSGPAGVEAVAGRMRKALAATLIGVCLALVAGEALARLAVTAGVVSDQFVELLAEARRGLPWRRQGGIFFDSKTVAPPDDVFAAGARYFRNRPDQHSLWHGGIPHTHDQYGFRNTRLVADWPEPGSGVYRIAVLGDSMTYGVGVENDETYPAVAQRWLDAWAPGRFALINGGVPGFSIQHLPPYYRHQVAPLGIDHVIHGVFMPDFARPQTFQKPGDDRYYRPDREGWRAPMVRYSTLAALIVYGAGILKPPDGGGEPAERARSRAALAGFLDRLSADGVTVQALLLPHRLTPPAETDPDRPAGASDLAWNREQFAPAKALYAERELAVLDGAEILQGVSTGACFEFGRINRVGHYSPYCNHRLGLALARHLYRQVIGGRPPAPGPAPLAAGEAPAATDDPTGDSGVPPPVTLMIDDRAITMIPVPAGRVQLGADPSAGFVNDDEAPRQAGIDAPFFLMKTEVTNDLWARYHAETGETDAVATPGLPRSYMSLRQAEAFAAWLSARSGAQFFVPSEHQWQHAARLDLDAGGPLDRIAVYERDGKPQPPCSRAPGRLGLCDMIGNLAEITSAVGRDDAVIKGGSFIAGPSRLRPAGRRILPPARAYLHVGLRLAARMTPPGTRR